MELLGYELQELLKVNQLLLLKDLHLLQLLRQDLQQLQDLRHGRRRAYAIP